MPKNRLEENEIFDYSHHLSSPDTITFDVQLPKIRWERLSPPPKNPLWTVGDTIFGPQGWTVLVVFGVDFYSGRDSREESKLYYRGGLRREVH